MFSQRYTAVVDACVLCSPLKRNIVASFAEAEFFRIRWSDKIMDETEKAVTIISSKYKHINAAGHAVDVRSIMNQAFQEANVTGYGSFEKTIGKIPDEGDRHVIAAALKSRADIIVTENLKDFPRKVISKFGIEAKSSDAFIADAIDFNPSLALVTVRRMLLRLGKNENAHEELLVSLKKSGLIQTAEQLRGRTID